jgi:hypothetical protein
MVKFGDINGETGSAAMADQDQALSTKHFKEKVLKEESERKRDYVKSTKKLLTP